MIVIKRKKRKESGNEKNLRNVFFLKIAVFQMKKLFTSLECPKTKRVPMKILKPCPFSSNTN
jgi:hypothetical protein